MDMSRICLTCLKAEHDMISMFSSVGVSGETVDIMIAACNLSISIDIEGLPQQLCKPCLQDLHSAYVFRKRSESSFRKLKILLLGDNENNDTKVDSTDATASSQIKRESPIIPTEKAVQTEDSCILICEFCKMKFFTEAELRTHRTSHKNAVIKCQICSTKYSRLSHLKRHVLTAHPKEFNASPTLTVFTCHICDKQFGRSDHMRKHVRNVHKVEPPKIKREKVQAPSPDQVDMKDDSDDDFQDEAAGSDSSCHVNGKSQVANESTTPVKIETLSSGGQEEAQPVVLSESKIERINETDNFIDVNVVITENLKAERVSGNEADSDHDEAFKPEVNIFDVFDNTFTSNLQLPEAMDSTPEKIQKKEFKCKSCHAIFPTQSERREHKCEVLSKTQHQCFECKKFFSRGCHLKRHMITHTSERPYSCEICGKGFRRHEHVRNHISTCHQQKEKAETITTTTSTTTENFVCEMCNKSFILRKYLRRHMLIHTRDSYDCRSCKEKFKTGKELSEHSKCHASERPHLCSECGLRFMRADYLVIHMRKHTGERPFKCQYCGKGFARQNLAMIHERYHTGQRSHLCTVCGKGFYEASNLAVHMRTHTGEKPYQCTHCDRSFAQSNDLKAHIRRHTGERYTCDICGDSFIQNYHLTRHKRTRHGIDAKPENVRCKVPQMEGALISSNAIESIANDRYAGVVEMPLRPIMTESGASGSFMQ